MYWPDEILDLREDYLKCRESPLQTIKRIPTVKFPLQTKHGSTQVLNSTCLTVTKTTAAKSSVQTLHYSFVFSVSQEARCVLVSKAQQ